MSDDDINDKTTEIYFNQIVRDVLGALQAGMAVTKSVTVIEQSETNLCAPLCNNKVRTRRRAGFDDSYANSTAPRWAFIYKHSAWDRNDCKDINTGIGCYGNI